MQIYIHSYLYLLTFLNGVGEVPEGHVFLEIPERNDSLLIANEEVVAICGGQRETLHTAKVVLSCGLNTV